MRPAKQLLNLVECGLAFREAVQKIEKEALETALEKKEFNYNSTSAYLRIKRATLKLLIIRHKIRIPEEKRLRNDQRGNGPKPYRPAEFDFAAGLRKFAIGLKGLRDPKAGTLTFEELAFLFGQSDLLELIRDRFRQMKTRALKAEPSFVVSSEVYQTKEDLASSVL